MYRYLLILFLCSLPIAAFAGPVEDAIQESRSLATKQKYGQALETLRKIEKDHADDLSLQIAIIRVLSWQKNYGAAEKALNALLPRFEKDPDLQLMQADLAYYRQDYERAIKIYRAILVKYPNYNDARQGLERIERIKRDKIKTEKNSFLEKKKSELPQKEPRPKQAQVPEQTPPLPAPKPAQWQITAGGEYSRLRRLPDPSHWNEEFVQIDYTPPQLRTTIHAQATRYERFSNIDKEIELGIDHSFGEALSGYLYGSFSPDANFRPRYHAATGTMLRVIDGKSLIPIWLTLDARYDVYTATKVLGLNPGLRIEFYPGWIIAGRMISVGEESAKRVYGWDMRLDETILDNLRMFIGYANAPETEVGVTVMTKSIFGGIAWDVTQKMTLRLSYTHEDRLKSYIREVVSASASYKF